MSDYVHSVMDSASSYLSNTVDYAIIAMKSVVDTVTGKLDEIAGVYSNLSSGPSESDDQTSISMLEQITIDKRQFDFVDSLRKNDPDKYAAFLKLYDEQDQTVRTLEIRKLFGLGDEPLLTM